MVDLPFKPSQRCTVGVELELQLVNTQNYNLATDAEDLLRGLAQVQHSGEVKPEITQSMIEINSSVHPEFGSLLEELTSIRDSLTDEARRLNVGIAGGGAHPFQKWSDRRIFPADRFHGLYEQYGYLAKQFTVFGQHIHIGCADGDEALYLAHALGRYVPQLVALSAASPFYQGVDTAFDSSRLSIISAFPLSGVLPFVHRWEEFLAYFDKMLELKVVGSIKDFYWDVRPKPEYGTVEIRVCDTPLTVDKSARIAAYAQALARYLTLERPFEVNWDQYLLYSVNRFQACRSGLQGNFINPYTHEQETVGADILHTIRLLEPHARALGGTAAISAIMQEVASNQNDAAWLRGKLSELKSLSDLVREQCALWMG
jgi:glutamate---cysteine ligase / carboxylate-amine ligase